MTAHDEERGSSATKPFRKRPCLIAIAVVLLLIFLLFIVLLILALTLFKPKQPTTEIYSASVDGIAPRLSFPRVDFQLNLTFDLQILVRNPNRASFQHGTGQSYLFYKDNQVGDTDIYPGLIPARGSTILPCRLTLQVDQVASNFTALLGDVTGGQLLLETRTTIPGRVKLAIFRKHMVATSHCQFTIGFPSMQIVNQECKNKQKF